MQLQQFDRRIFCVCAFNFGVRLGYQFPNPWICIRLPTKFRRGSGLKWWSHWTSENGRCACDTLCELLTVQTSKLFCTKRPGENCKGQTPETKQTWDLHKAEIDCIVPNVTPQALENVSHQLFHQPEETCFIHRPRWQRCLPPAPASVLSPENIE